MMMSCLTLEVPEDLLVLLMKVVVTPEDRAKSPTPDTERERKKDQYIH